MTPPELLAAGTSSVASLALPHPEWQISFEDAFGAGQRLWVRGRLLLTAPRDPAETRRWWQLRRKGERPPLPATLRLETRFSSQRLEADLPVNGDGRFEATLTACIRAARRGWRTACHRVKYAGQTAEACNIVLLPPDDAPAGATVLLPLSVTWSAEGPQLLHGSAAATHVPQRLTQLRRMVGGAFPVYYLACVSPHGPDPRAELALAATALGWPAGHFLVLPTELKDSSKAFAAALDRLRWLFAGHLDLWMLNLEPSAAAVIEENRTPRDDRALARELKDRREAPSRRPNDRRLGALRDAAPLPRAARSALLTRHPIVFCHGMLAFSMLKMQIPEDPNYFSPLGEFLRQRGFRVLFPQVPATSGVVERAERLKEQILRWTDEPVNLIAHSMGGLDARYLITHLDMAERVRSLTTIGTPHRGSYMADWFAANYRQRVPLLLALEAVGLNVDGFRDCRLDVCREFNRKTPDRPEVRYFSFGGQVQPARLTPFLRRAWNILTPVEGPNDGLVSVRSATWGEYLGTIRADHFAQTPDGVFVRDREDFDSLGFFTRLVEDLARRGF